MEGANVRENALQRPTEALAPQASTPEHEGNHCEGGTKPATRPIRLVPVVGGYGKANHARHGKAANDKRKNGEHEHESPSQKVGNE